MRTDHQQHAAYCRHAESIEAKRIYCRELTEHFAAFRPAMPLESRLIAYASYKRRAVLDCTSRFGFRPSTLRTWLREWKALACSDR